VGAEKVEAPAAVCPWTVLGWHGLKQFALHVQYEMQILISNLGRDLSSLTFFMVFFYSRLVTNNRFSSQSRTSFGRECFLKIVAG
jgi:hypothetical protein